MTVHLLAPPNVQTTSEYSMDGFGAITIRFAKLLKSLGYSVILYGGEENEAPCDEFVTVFTKGEQRKILGKEPYYCAIPSPNHPLWVATNFSTIPEIRRRLRPRDFICSIGGVAQKMIADYIPSAMFVEYSIGYQGCFSPYRVYQSRAWQHYIHGSQNQLDGRFFDSVIPAFFEPEKYPFVEKKEDYAVYVGRLIERKGVGIACKAARLAGKKLLVCGWGNPKLVTDGAEYVGPLNEKDKIDLLSRAAVTLCPTQYMEPFGCVAVESQLCGTPVISTDFGAFTETIENGVTGWRCSYLGEFVKAIREGSSFNHRKIRELAKTRYSVGAAAPQYDAYFSRLNLLWGKGWDSLAPAVG